MKLALQQNKLKYDACNMLTYFTIIELFYFLALGNYVRSHSSSQTEPILPPLKKPKLSAWQIFQKEFGRSDGNYYWRASVASETLTGVTPFKIGDVCLFI